ncbi:MAG: cobalt ECF transporter T component CbiQ [Acidimicrobiia bacterium]
MGAGHGGGTGGFHTHRDTPVHRLAPEVKVAATLAFVAVVVATPWHLGWLFAFHALLAGTAAGLARLRPGFVLRALRFDLPFVGFAVLLPLVGQAPRVEVAGLALSRPGLVAAGTILAKSVLGLAASLVLVATTPPADVLAGLERLRVPRVLVAIAGFMVRYLDVIAADARRTRIARLSRADDPRWLWQARAVAATAGTLFVRSYERGERVHLAMLSRGYDGAMPALHQARAGRAQWLAAMAIPATAALALLLATVALR